MTPAEKRARMKRGEGSPAARRPGGEPPTAGDGWGVSVQRLGGCERAAGRRVSSLASAHWRRCAISARFLAQFPFPDFCDFYSAPHETNNIIKSTELETRLRVRAWRIRLLRVFMHEMSRGMYRPPRQRQWSRLLILIMIYWSQEQVVCEMGLRQSNACRIL